MTGTFLALSLYAQGTVSFNNDNNSCIYNFFAGRPVTQSDGFHVALYWAPLSNPDNFTQLGGSVSVGFPIPGRFFGGNRTTGNETSPGGQARFMVLGWELAYGPTYEAAIAAPPMNGRLTARFFSPVFVLTTGGGLIPPASLTGTELEPVFLGVPCPEPSVIALTLLGAGIGGVLWRRRKA